jgi:hypothetical protein
LSFMSVPSKYAAHSCFAIYVILERALAALLRELDQALLEMQRHARDADVHARAFGAGDAKLAAARRRKATQRSSGAERRSTRLSGAVSRPRRSLGPSTRPGRLK